MCRLGSGKACQRLPATITTAIEQACQVFFCRAASAFKQFHPTAFQQVIVLAGMPALVPASHARRRIHQKTNKTKDQIKEEECNNNKDQAGSKRHRATLVAGHDHEIAAGITQQQCGGDSNGKQDK